MRHIYSILSLLAVMLCGAVPAYAEGAAHVTHWMDLVWRIVTVGIVIGVIVYFAGKSIAVFFANRRTSIEKELYDLEARKEDAKANLKAVEARIASLDAERATILANYQAQGETIKAQIIAKAEASATAMTEQAKQAAQNEIDQAVSAMRAELADRIADAVQKSLGKALSSAEHERLIDSFLNKVVLQ